MASKKTNRAQTSVKKSGNAINAIGDILGSLVKGALDSNGIYSLANAGMALGETKAAARLQARATVFAALVAKPYKTGEKPRAELVAEAVAVVTDLEQRPAAPRLEEPAIDALIQKFEMAISEKNDAEEERGAHPEVYDRAHAHLRFVRNRLREALGAPIGGFGFMAGTEKP